MLPILCFWGVITQVFAIKAENMHKISPGPKDPKSAADDSQALPRAMSSLAHCRQGRKSTLFHVQRVSKLLTARTLASTMQSRTSDYCCLQLYSRCRGTLPGILRCCNDRRLCRPLMWTSGLCGISRRTRFRCLLGAPEVKDRHTTPTTALLVWSGETYSTPSARTLSSTEGSARCRARSDLSLCFSQSSEPRIRPRQVCKLGAWKRS